MLALAMVASALLPAAAYALGPGDFVFEDAAPGAGFVTPTGLAFFPDGRMLVIEKAGVAWVVEGGAKHAEPLWSATNEVLTNGDRGLLGVAVDPNYAANHFVYFAYVVDPDSDGVDDDLVAFGRVTRYRTSAADSNVVDPASRTVLLGATWAGGVPNGGDSHTIDALRFGADGSLLISAGEGALFATYDRGGITPELFLPGRTDPYEDIGSFRAQSVSSLAGKLLRIDPATGLGYPSNPFYDGDPSSNRSKVWAYGLRNPWRFCVRPGTGSGDPALGRPGSIYVGNVGLNQWEALCVARAGGENFGWPCWEGQAVNPGATLFPPAHNGCDSFGTPDNPSFRTAPVIGYHHTDSTLGIPPGFVGNGITGGVFYTGPNYPDSLRGAYFFADFGPSWIKLARFDSLDRVVRVTDFAMPVAGPVDFAASPVDGDLYFVAIYENIIKHVRYTGPVGGNYPPVADATATPMLANAPREVVFVGAGSFDPEHAPITHQWNFGDGQGAVTPNARHTFDLPGRYTAVLTVRDALGAIGRDTALVVLTESERFPTTNPLDTFDRADGPVGSAWAGGTTGLRVRSNALELLGGGAWGLWDNAAFGSDQEAYFRFATSPDAEGRYALFLKAQGTNLFDGCLRVRWDAKERNVFVSAWEPGAGWGDLGAPIAVTFEQGDQFGARLYVNGVLQVLRNNAIVGTMSVEEWTQHALGGRIGLELVNAGASLVDDFGGGDAVIDGNLPPTVTLESPLDGAPFVAGDTVRLVSAYSDDRDPPDSLAVRWSVDLMHNNHVHPDIFTATGPEASFVAENHDDGTGVSYRVRLSVTDRGALTTTRVARLWPEVDLSPTVFTHKPDTLGVPPTLTYAFTIHNNGRMPAPNFRWQLTLSDGTTLAQGDTLVPAHEFVRVQGRVTPLLPAGTYDLRVVVDTLEAVRETDESDNAAVRTLVVTDVPLAVDGAPSRFALSAARPNPTRGGMRLALDLPRAARVSLRVFDVQGREVWRSHEAARAAGRWELEWPGRRAAGGDAAPGLYLARVEVDARAWVRRFVKLE